MKSREEFGYSETIADTADSDRELLPQREKKPRPSVGTSSSEGRGFFYILG